MFSVNSQAIARIGYGAMGLEGYYGQSDDTTAIQTIVHAIERNMMIDTADAYGAGHNEVLIREAMRRPSRKAFVATKFGIVFEEGQTGSQLPTGWGFPLTINGTRPYVLRAIDQSLERLGVERLDLVYAHYLDPQTPLEETVAAMAEAVGQGKVGAIGLSNVTADEIRRAHAVHPVAAVQYEYSLFRREAEREILPTVEEIGALLVCWSPLGAGFLTGQVTEIAAGDFRNNNPKMQGENFVSNLTRLERIKELAAGLGITPASLALAWLLARSPRILPIPGSRKASRIDENLQALSVSLSPETLAGLDEIAPVGAFQGASLV